MSFELRKKGNISYLIIPSFERSGLVIHGFSTRLGGVSTGEYSSLNLGLKKADDKKKVLENYRLFCSALHLNVKDLVASDQVHGDEIYEAFEDDKGKGIVRESDIINKDALMTRQRGVVLVTYYADCVPLFFLDIKTPAIALAHAGWRGTVKKIGQKTVREMIRKYETRPENVLVGIGPCIKKCCYEVDEPVVKSFKGAFNYWEELVEDKGGGHFMLDLVRANKRQLEDVGVIPENITVSDYCTSCRNDLFFSYRKDHGKTGSLAAFLMLAH